MASKNKNNKNKIPRNDDLDNFIKDLPVPEEKKRALGQRIQARITYSQGPLPPPQILSDYNNIVENGAERLMKMAEAQTAHRIRMESDVIMEQVNESKNGQRFAFVIAILGLAVTLILALTGHDAVAGIVGGGTLVSLVTAFIYGKRKQEKTLNEKRPK